MATLESQLRDRESHVNKEDHEITTFDEKKTPTLNRDDLSDVDLKPAGLLALRDIKSTWNVKSLGIAWGGAIALSFAVAYDQTTSSSFTPYATSDFGELALLGTIGTIQAVIAAVMQQPLAILADVYGRFELFGFCIVIITVGQIMLTASTNINVFAGAQIFFVVGLLGLTLMLQLFAGDSSDLNNRLLISAIPILPVIITSWTSAPVVTAILKNTTWRWGYGIFAVLFPILSLPLLSTLWWNQRKSRKVRKANGTYEPSNHWSIFQQLDPVGFLFFTAGLSLVLLPITLAASSTGSWHTPHIIVMIVIGVVTLAALAVWEWRFAKLPILPIDLFGNRTVIFAGLAQLLDYLGVYTFQNYFFSYMVVYSNLSVAAATNVLVIQPFMACFGLLIAGIGMKFFGRPKWIIAAGFCVNTLAMGLTFAYRNAHSRIAPLLVAQGLFGLGEGIVYTAQTAMQAAVGEQSMARVTALSSTTGAIGNAFGAAVSGGIWTNVLPKKLLRNLPTALIPQLSDIVGSVGLALSYEWGTPERIAIAHSYDETFRILLIIGTCCQAASLISALCMEDLNTKAIDESRDYGGMVIGKTGAAGMIRDQVHGNRDDVVHEKRGSV